MNDATVLKDKLTILVNSCDSYEDLWVPFFTLFRKYWKDKSIRVLLNTESKTFSMDGLQIECVSCAEGTRYGARMVHALSQIKTEYVMILLDDFFLRQPVDSSRIQQIISWMDADQDIVYFNSDCTSVYADWEVDRYPGFKRIPPGTEYTLNLQAAIWRTSKLKDYWNVDASPWEWEVVVNARTFFEKNNKFYCTTAKGNAICDYGYNSEGMGVFRGKWVADDVVPLFKKENIKVDFERRGYYNPLNNRRVSEDENRLSLYKLIIQCLGVPGLVGYLIYRMYYKICIVSGKECYSDYFVFLQEEAQRRFLKRYSNR